MDLKKREFYIIRNVKNNLNAQWGKDVILFDTEEEAQEMIELFPKFFNLSEIEIRKAIIFIDNKINYKKINYKDLKQTEDFIKESKGE